MKSTQKKIAKEMPPPPTGPLSPSRRLPSIAVAHRRQTHEEQRQFNAALDVFLAEWVRQQLGPAEVNNEVSIS